MVKPVQLGSAELSLEAGSLALPDSWASHSGHTASLGPYMRQGSCGHLWKW